MRSGWMTFGFVALFIGGSGAHAGSFLVNAGGTGSSETGAWNTLAASTFIRLETRFTQNAAATQTFTPSGVGFAPGNYNLYVQWDAFNGSPPATSDALYTINHVGGATAVHIDQRKQARQSAATGVPFTDATGSGYYYLGNFNLDNASSVALQKAAGEPTTYLTSDALYGTSDGFLIDELSDKAVYTNWGGTTGVFGYPNNGLSYNETSVYAFSNQLGATVTYTPGLSGKREIKISWAALDILSPNVGYVVDLDGNPLTLGDRSSFTIDMTKTAAGVSPTGTNNHTWSDFFSLGIYTLTPTTTITAINNTSAFLTTDVMFISNLIPEPASLAVSAAGLLVVAGGRARRR